NMRNLSIGKNVTINTDPNTILQIDLKFDSNDKLKFGNGASCSGAKVYVGACGLNWTTERAVTFAHGSIVYGTFFVPTGWIDIGGGNNLFGHFWARRISGDPNNNVTNCGCTLSAEANETNIKCYGNCDGKINLTVFNGVSPTYHWAKLGGGFTSADKNISGLCAGTYAV